MPDPIFAAIVLGKLTWWVCNHACASIISSYEEQVRARLRISHDVQHNGDLQKALHTAFGYTIGGLRERANAEDEKNLWQQVYDAGKEWLSPERAGYPVEFLATLLYDDPGTGGWATCWNPFEKELESFELRPFFKRNQRQVEIRLQARFAHLLRTKPYHAAAIAYQQAMLSEIQQTLKDRNEIPPEVLATVEALATVPDLIDGMSDAILSALGSQDEAQVEHARETAQSLGELARDLDRLRHEMQGQFVSPDGTTIRCDLLGNCEPVRKHLVERPLGGRDDDMRTLSEKLGNRAVVAVTAPAGGGKSALLAHWIERLKQDPENAGTRVCYHLFSLEDDTARLGGGMACLVEQLLAVHRIRGRVSETEPDRLKAALRQLLSMSHARRLVVVLDGLDEALDPARPGKFAFGPGWFPPALGESVGVVLGIRHAPGVSDPAKLADRLGVEAIDELPLDNLDTDAICDLLNDDGRKDLAEPISVRTGGLAIYVAMVAEAINQAGNQEDAGALVDQLPADFSQYVSDELGAEARDQRQWLDALGFLAVASGPLTSRELLQLCRDSEPKLRQVDLANPPWEIARWLTQRDGETWSFQHDAIGDVWRELFNEECASCRLRLLEDCANWTEHKGPYSLRHYPSDLLQCGGEENHEKLIALALNVEYRAAQRYILPQEPALPLQTIQAAIRAAVETDRIVDLVDLVFTYAQVVGQYRNESPLEAAQRGDLARALWLAGLHDPEQEFLSLLLVAWHEADQGAQEHVNLVMTQLAQMPIFKLSETARVISVTAIAHAVTLRGNARFASWIHQHLGANDFAIVATIQANAGDLDGARATVDSIDAPWLRTDALVAIARAQAAAGDFAGARATADSIDDPRRRTDALVAIARARAAAGDFAGARATADSIDDPWRRTWGLAAIASAQAISMDGFRSSRATLAGLLATPKSTPLDRQCGEALAIIAAAQTAAGDTAGALATVARIKPNRQREEALVAISGAQVADKDFTGALSTATPITDDWKRARALTTIALAQATIGDVTGAQATITAISVEQQRNEAIAAVASIQAASKGIDSACAAALTIVDDDRRDQALLGVTIAQTAIKDTRGALATAAMISSDWRRGNALTEIVTANITAGELTSARISANSIPREWQRARALIQVAAGHVATGDVHEAYAIAVTLADSWSYTHATRAILKATVSRRRDGEIEDHALARCADTMIGALEVSVALAGLYPRLASYIARIVLRHLTVSRQ